MDILNALIVLANFVLVPAITYGSQLALGALGVTMIYGILRFSNFAHGDSDGHGHHGGDPADLVVPVDGDQRRATAHRPARAAFAIAATIVFLLVTDRLVYRFYRRQKAKPIIFVMASLGVMFVYNGLVRFVLGPDDHRFTDGERFIISVRDFKALTGMSEGLAIRTTQGLTVITAVIVVAALFWFLGRTRTGKSMRAYSDNEDLALLSGINPERVVMYTWMIVAGLITIAGVLYGLDKMSQAVHLFPASAADLCQRHRRWPGQPARRHRGRVHHRVFRGDDHLCVEAGADLCVTG